MPDRVSRYGAASLDTNEVKMATCRHASGGDGRADRNSKNRKAKKLQKGQLFHNGRSSYDSNALIEYKYNIKQLYVKTAVRVAVEVRQAM